VRDSARMRNVGWQFAYGKQVCIHRCAGEQYTATAQANAAFAVQHCVLVTYIITA